MMKKTISLLLALALVLSLAACGGKDDTPANDPKPPAENEQTDAQQPAEPAGDPASAAPEAGH